MKNAYLILHNIRSAHNVGSIFRTADAAGVKQIFLTGYTPAPVDRFGRKRDDVAKVALDATESVAWEQREDPIELIKELKDQDIEIVSLEQSPDSIDYKKYQPKKPFALVLGEEVNGITQDILDLSDKIIEIPMKGEKESLNVSVATGVALFRILDI